MRVTQFLKASLFKFLGDNCPQQAAALAFYTFFSLPPLLFLLLTVVGLVLDPAVAAARIEAQFSGLVGQAGAEQISGMLEAVGEADTAGGLGAVLGVVLVLFGATAAFAQLQASLNRVFRVEPDPTRGDIGNFLLKRLLSFAMVLSVAFLLLVSLALSTLLAAFGDFLGQLLPGELSEPVLAALHLAVDFAAATVLFALMYRVLPDARFAWRDVTVGAVVTAVLFIAGKFAIGYYLGRSDPGTAYGAAGSLALVMIWVYYSAMVLLGGAVLTYVWADQRGAGVRPEPGAVEVRIEKHRQPTS
ncbi:MAG TPA: YihY/virulence factor BrkB family protein [Longimicrobiales bacterium]|nr:YihY/virulence factor BrkB family protein [Longimicrobiales bacterium]